MTQVVIGNTTLRIWLDESFPWETSDYLIHKQTISLLDKDSSVPTSNQQGGIELFKPLGPRFEYGALSGAFFPAKSKELEVEIIGYLHPIQVMETLLSYKLGIPSTFIDPESISYLINGIIKVKDRLSGGKLRITGGLSHSVGTSDNLLYQLSQLLVVVLLRKKDDPHELQSFIKEILN